MEDFEQPPYGYSSSEDMTDEEAEEDEPPKLINVKKRKMENGESSAKKAKLSPLDKLMAEGGKKQLSGAPKNEKEVKEAIKQAKETSKKLIDEQSKKKKKQVEEDDDDDDDDDSYEDMEEDSDDDEGEEEEDSDEDGEEEEESDDEEEESEEEETPKKKVDKKDNKTPKKEGMKNGAPKTPQTDKKQDNNKTPKKQDQQQGTPKPKKTPKKTLKGGIVVEELKEGNGPEAKRGKMMGMYYDGRLTSNNKRFDANLKGDPFKFRLGSGEVIKGWDVGLEGIKVGGKRKLTIPAKMAYGSTGAPPAIPPNATLTFEVECKFVK